MSVQDTVGTTIAFAGVLHLGASIPLRTLRCVLDTRDMVTVDTARFNSPVIVGRAPVSGVMVPDAPGLGITVDRDVLRTPIAFWQV